MPESSSLTSLPVEILAAIVAYLGPSQADYDIFNDGYMPDLSLYYLSQTCKAVSTVSLYKLYEICPLVTERHFHSTWRALHTLAARPDIASKVKRIIVDGKFPSFDRKDRYDYSPTISAQDAALFNRILETKVDMATVTPLRELKGASEVLGDEESEAIGRSLACVALSIAPNATSVVFEGSLTTRLGSFKACAFPRLEAISLRDFYITTTKFEYIPGLLDAAPNFKRFIGDCLINLAMPKMPCASMTQVVLDLSTLDEDSAALIPVVFPNLQSFTYKFNGQTYPDQGRLASPQVISKALLGLRRTLTHVVLACAVFKNAMWEHFPDGQHHGMESLSQMRVLQSLRLPAWFSCPTSLVDFLPPSIQELYLDCQELESDVLPDIDMLLQTLPTRFPNLTLVNFDALDDQLQQQVKQGYEQLGIACRFQDLAITNYRGD